MTLRTRPFHWRSGRGLIPFIVLLAGLLATVAAVVYIGQSARTEDEIRFANAVTQISNTISTKVETYVALLRAGAGLFEASDEVSLEEFRRFVGGLDLRGRYPGIQGIGFAERVASANLAPLVARMEAAGMSGFAVSPADPRPEYFPIVYLEPLDRRNRAAVGYDMFTESVRRAAMERAVRTGVPSASGKVVLRQEIDPEKQAGFLIYMAVYRVGVPRATEAERSASLVGFVYSPFRAGDFLRAVLEEGGRPQVDVDVKVYDGDAATRPALLFASTGSASPRARFRRTVRLGIAGRTWLVDVTTSEAFEASGANRQSIWILLVGFAVSALLFVLTRSEVKARTLAERSEEALRTSESELRRLVDAERRAHAEAASANRAKDEFLATLSHELRTPLNAILGWATMLKGGRLDADQEARAVEVIARNARTQAQLIEDLLDVSRIITGKLLIDVQPAALSGPVQAALDAVRPAAQAKGVEVERQFSTDGPVLGDPARLQQVAWNLLSNAIKFTPAGGRVVVSLEQQDSRVSLTVRDTGMGIQPAFLPHVFERFRQHDSSTTRAYGGMGLGLAIVWHLTELHGGTVRAESEGEGRGATFTVQLPLRVAKADEARPSPADAGDHSLAGIRILLVDDDHDSREVLASALTQANAVVVAAASAEGALQALTRERVDVVLADISMPETDGYAFLRRIRSHASPTISRLPAVAVTAYAREEDRQKAEAAGFQAHIAKPVDIAALCDAIRRLVAATQLSTINLS